jgi:hypothetical protein
MRTGRKVYAGGSIPVVDTTIPKLGFNHGNPKLDKEPTGYRAGGLPILQSSTGKSSLSFTIIAPVILALKLLEKC